MTQLQLWTVTFWSSEGEQNHHAFLLKQAPYICLSEQEVPSGASSSAFVISSSPSSFSELSGVKSDYWRKSNTCVLIHEFIAFSICFAS